ncbi:MAG: SDR family oxidoreductase [Pseudomonadota bacterium]
MSNLNGRVALITGASRGIGLATVHELSSLGAQVVLAARSEAPIQDITDQISENGGRAVAVQCDVASFEQVQAAVSSTIARFDRLDILVNNAGTIEPIARIDESEPDLWSKAIDVNLKGVYHGLRAALPVMTARGGGVIVNLSSGAATSALEGWSHYCASKAAVKMLTACAHKEFSEQGIRVVGLSPGTVATDMMSSIKSSGINPVSQLDWSTHIPPEWAAKAIAFLCGPGGEPYAGSDFSIKTDEGRAAVGLPPI